MGKNLKGKELGKGISQRKDGRYMARYIDVTGKRRSIYGDKLSDVRRQLVEAQYKTQNDMATYNSNMTVDEWYHVWIKTYKEGKIKNTTLKNIESTYRILIKPYIARRKLSQIKQVDIQNIINKEHIRGAANSTIREEMSKIYNLMQAAFNSDLITKNPCYNLTYPKESTYLNKCKERRALTKTEEKMLLNMLPLNHWGNLLKLLLFTGVRVGEACALQWGHIDLTQQEINIIQNISGNVVSTPKTKNSIRTIPIGADAFNLIEQHKTLCDNISDGDYVFCRKYAQHFTPNQISNLLHYFLQSNNFENFNVTPHILRHTFATRCFEAGIDPKIIQMYLGHSNIQTTLNIYTHTDINLLKKNITKLSFGVKMVSNS